MKDLKLWGRAAGVRAVKTMAQTFAAMAGTCAIMAEVDWPVVASATALAGILSIAMSLAGLPEVVLQEQLDEQVE